MKEYWKTHWWAVSTLCFSLPHPPPPPFLSLLSLSLQGLTSVCLFQLSRCDCGLPPASSSFQYNNHTELERGGRKKIFCLSGKLQVELIITYKFLCCRFNLMRAQQLLFFFFISAAVMLSDIIVKKMATLSWDNTVLCWLHRVLQTLWGVPEVVLLSENGLWQSNLLISPSSLTQYLRASTWCPHDRQAWSHSIYSVCSSTFVQIDSSVLMKAERRTTTHHKGIC